MSEDVVVVEARTGMRLRAHDGRSVLLRPGTYAVARQLIQRTLDASARVDVVDRAPTAEELATAREKGLVAEEVATQPSDPRTLTDLRKAELQEIADLLGVDREGNKSDLVDRLAGSLEVEGILWDSPASEIYARLRERTE